MLKTLDCSDAYELDSFSVKQESLEICSDLLNGKKPVSILFYGKPGSGKTELAKSLCRQTGKHVYIFKNEVETNDRCNVLGRLVCLLSMERKDSILIVDEAESMPKTMLKNIAKQKIEPLAISEDAKSELVAMFETYHLSVQSVENIVKTIDAMDCKDEDTMLKKAEIVMKENSLLLNGKTIEKEVLRPCHNFCVNGRV